MINCNYSEDYKISIGGEKIFSNQIYYYTKHLKMSNIFKKIMSQEPEITLPKRVSLLIKLLT